MTHDETEWHAWVNGGREDNVLLASLLLRQAWRVRNLAWHVAKSVGYRVAADDLYQEGYVALCDCVKKYDPERCPFWGFAYRRVHGAMVDYLRRCDPIKRLQRKRGFDCLTVQLDVDVIDPKGESCVEHGIREHIRHLRMEDQVIVWLHFAMGKKLEDIASFYGVSKGRISQRLASIMKELRLYVDT